MKGKILGVAIREYIRALRDMTANEKALKDDKALILVLEGLQSCSSTRYMKLLLRTTA